MIIYGSRAVHVNSAQIAGAQCPSCGTQGSFVTSVFAKYAHVFWIPMFPLGKVTIAECNHCKRTLTLKEMPPDLKNAAVAIETKSSTPKWAFTGIGIVVLFMIYANISGNRHNEDKKLFISSPKIGDIYKYTTKNGTYSLLRVAQVTGDSVFVEHNQYEITRMSKLYKIDKADNYLPIEVGILKAELKKKFDSGEIFDIDRP